MWAGVSAGGGEFLLITAQGQAIRFCRGRSAAHGPACGRHRRHQAGGEGSRGRGDGASARAKEVPVTRRDRHRPGLSASACPWPTFRPRGATGRASSRPSRRPSWASLPAPRWSAPGDSLLCLTVGGGAKPIPAADLPEMGRPAQGKAVIPLVGGDQVTRLVAAAEQTKAKVEVKTEAKKSIEANKDAAPVKPGARAAQQRGNRRRPRKARRTNGDKANFSEVVCANDRGEQNFDCKAGQADGQDTAQDTAGETHALWNRTHDASKGRGKAGGRASGAAEPAAKPSRTRKVSSEQASLLPPAAPPPAAPPPAPPPPVAPPEPPKPSRRSAAQPATTTATGVPVTVPVKPAAKSPSITPAEKPAAKKTSAAKSDGPAPKPAAGATSKGK